MTTYREREATWSASIKVEYRRCGWPWCCRSASQICRVFVAVGNQIVTFGQRYCDGHTEKRKTMNLELVNAK